MKNEKRMKTLHLYWIPKGVYVVTSFFPLDVDLPGIIWYFTVLCHFLFMLFLLDLLISLTISHKTSIFLHTLIYSGKTSQYCTSLLCVVVHYVSTVRFNPINCNVKTFSAQLMTPCGLDGTYHCFIGFENYFWRKQKYIGICKKIKKKRIASFL